MFKHILVPIDTSNETSWKKALPDAIKLAKTHGATLHVMTVVPDFGSAIVASYFPEGFEQKALEEARLELHKIAEPLLPKDLPHQLITAHGRIWQEICNTARKVEADLIVIASHKPALRDTLLAPTAEQVLHHVDISVLVIR